MLNFSCSRMFWKDTVWRIGKKVYFNPVLSVLLACPRCLSHMHQWHCGFLIPHKARVNAIQLTEHGPPVAQPATQIYETIIFFASAALGDIACQRLLLLKWDIYDSELLPHESGLLNHFNAAEGGREMRFDRLLKHTTCASSLITICQFQCKNNLTCIELRFTKIMIWGIYRRKLAAGVVRCASSEADEVGVE